MVDLDEYNAGDLMRTLPRESPRPPLVDVARAMREGRRRRSARRAAVAGTIGVAVLVVLGVPAALLASRDDSVPPPVGTSPTVAPPSGGTDRSTGTATAAPQLAGTAPVPTSCHAERLPVPDGAPESLVTAADPSGRLIFGLTYSAGHVRHPVRWQDGKATMLHLAGEDPEIDAVNADGLAAGFSGGAGAKAFLFRDGQVVDLPGGAGVRPTGINAHGAVVGNGGRQAVVWRAPDAQPEALRLPSGGASFAAALDIDDDGTVVGQVTFGVQSRAYAWGPDGVPLELPMPQGTPTSPNGGSRPGPSAEARQVRNGWAAGVAGLYSAQPRWLRWNLRTGTVEVLTGIDVVGPVNLPGWVAGETSDGRAVLLAGGKRITLPDGAGHHGQSPSNSAQTISDDGRIIAGQSWDSSDKFHAIVWRCS